MTEDWLKPKPATRKDFKAVISIAGDSGSGKTYSALRLARGIVGPTGKIGFIDTENRAGMYADCFGGFDIINLEAPYSPERYKAALQSLKSLGYQCVIIDSMSHEWESKGGIIDIADNITTKDGRKRDDVGRWAEPKKRHRMMMDEILRCGMHVILCFRVKYPMVEVIDPKTNKKTWERSGQAEAVQEPSQLYDISLDMFLDKDTKFPTLGYKKPEALEYLFPSDSFVTEEAGAGIVEWLNSPQRDKDAIIREGSRQVDMKAWYSKLPPAEQYLAKKYNAEIKKQNTSKPTEVQPEPTIGADGKSDVEI